jgi:prophage antirepressor-like protein
MNALTRFDFDDHAVLVEMVDGSPWFCAGPVGQCLGMTPRAARAAAGTLDDDQRSGISIAGRPGPPAIFVSESGLYAMIMQSRKPAAKRFQRWVTSEVLPAIRKSGRYEIAPKTLEERSLLLLTELHGVVENQKLVIATQADTIAVMEPAHENSQARCRAKILSTTSWTWKSAMGRRKLTRDVWELFYDLLFVKMRNGYRWREWAVRAGWGADVETVHEGAVRVSAQWFERGRLALPLWLAEQDRQRTLP